MSTERDNWGKQNIPFQTQQNLVDFPIIITK